MVSIQKVCIAKFYESGGSIAVNVSFISHFVEMMATNWD